MSSTRTRVLGTTRIEAPVGRGGMAQVYRGKQRLLGRSVAVKVMLPEIARDKDMVQRFRREARTLAALHHENIVAVHDLVEKNAQIFMVLEYVEGVDVGELLADGKPLPLDVALIVATGLARALEHAHFHRVVHRDIKPSNVMVSRRGEVKLADFGIAKELGDVDLTRTGFVVGTPSFLAPEVLKGQRADHRADLYAVGVLLFQLLTAKKPFAGEDAQQLVAAILSGRREKVRALASDCPRAVEKIVDRCLERDLDARYASAAELRKDLEVQLNAVSSGNPSARLVGFLFSRGHAGPDDLATLNVGDLAAANPTLDLSAVEFLPTSQSIEVELEETPGEEAEAGEREDETGEPTAGSRRRRWPLAVAATFALVGALGVATYALAPAETEAVAREVLDRAAALTR